jgi:hypothetical protein
MTDPSEFRWPPPGLERLQGDLWTSGGEVRARRHLPGSSSSFRDDLSAGPRHARSVRGRMVDHGGARDDGTRVRRRRLRAARPSLPPGPACRRAWVTGCRPSWRSSSDRRRDMGFLMRGARHFSIFDRPASDVLVTLRLLTPSLSTRRLDVWLCLALAVGLVDGGAWLDGSRTAWPLVDARARRSPLRVRCDHGSHGRREGAGRSGRSGTARVWEDDLDPERVRGMGGDGSRAGAAGGRGARGVLGTGSLGRFSVAHFRGRPPSSSLPVLLLFPASAIGPALTRVSVPEYQAIQRRAAELEVIPGLPGGLPMRR